MSGQRKDGFVVGARVLTKTGSAVGGIVVLVAAGGIGELEDAVAQSAVGSAGEASNCPLMTSVAALLISIVVPAAMVTTTPLCTVTVP